ncbi:LIP-domain-containing protein [Lindgomyces ingoldianus]|uniref:LIP-domain-containing protein n=1 Tax=Lindgomyces ingoldianus TaxID=673940 RepID=A0ACB6QNS7_9PLEO|nr:LIP-domain-containing protein [Lindgomyces ingoldianus]KAF2467811.1 LIP-domain-containing protein [Lindgomyces ingoldianus]
MHSILRAFPVLASIASVVLAAPTPVTTACPSASTVYAPPSSLPAIPTLAVAITCSLPPSASTTPPSTPLPPSGDPWYRPPDNVNWLAAQPGDILRLRPAPGNAIANLKFLDTCVGFQAYNILYRTTDSHYKPTWAVTTVIAPLHVGDSPHSLLSYQHPYDSANLDSSPSYQIYKDSSLQTAIGLFLKRGWFVNVPDYEGPNAAFGSGVMSGHATLDSVRAALNGARAVGVPVGARGEMYLKYAMYGYSGGSFATEWAAELQVQYAPDLRFAGAGIGGAYPNITSALAKISSNLNKYPAYIGHLGNITVGIANENEDAQAVAMAALGKTSWADTIQAVKDMNLHPDALQKFINDVTQNPTVRSILNRDGMMGYHGVPQMPLLIHRADGDQISSTSDTTKLYDEYCGVGANIYYHITPTEATNSDPHYNEGYVGTIMASEGLNQMFKGTFPKGCQTENSANWPWPFTLLN